MMMMLTDSDCGIIASMNDRDSRVLLGEEALGHKGRSMEQLDLRNGEFHYNPHLLGETLTRIGVGILQSPWPRIQRVLGMA